LRGHGRSGGPRCHVNDFNDYILDLDIFIKFFEKNYGKKNTFLVSHSLGGLVAIFYSLNFPYTLQGLVLCSPCLGLKLKVEPIKGWLASVFYPILKNVSFSTHIKARMATHDRSIMERFKDDPLIHHTVTASFYIQMMMAMRYVKSHADQLKAPILILQAGNDMICDAKATQNFYNMIGSPDKQFKSYGGFYHEILNETEREKVFMDIYNWIKVRSENEPRTF
jgi:alpha-beta hydrolase superfamily lysophospholipase